MVEKENRPLKPVLPVARFETATNSLAEGGKDRCGDHILVKTVGPHVVAVVSDGVGSKPCDWRASQIVCEALLETFTVNSLSAVHRLRSSVEEAHRMVQKVSGDCSGLLATLVAVVWTIGSEYAHIVSIGDSRIYRASATSVRQISMDDTSAEVYTRFGKPVVVAGAAVTYPVITKAMGQHQPLAIEVEKISFKPGESIILATDGMYHVSTFEERLLTTVRTSSLADGVTQLFRLCADEFSDDATIAILRRSDVADKETYRRVIESSGDYRRCQLFGHITCSTLIEMVHEALARDDVDRSLTFIQYARQYNLRLSKANLIELLDVIAIHPRRDLLVVREMFDMIRQMIRLVS